MATFYLDFEGGNDANDGTTFANRWLTITSGATAARIAPGDTIRVMASPDQTLVDSSASWTQDSKTVTLSGAVTANISDCGTAWTASANVTATTTATRKEGSLAAQMAFAGAFTTGLAAYFATGTLDLSGYQQVSFWFRTNATIAASTLSLRLCTDTVGAVSVHTIAIPAVNATGRFIAFTVNLGTNLNSAIQSVALYADLDPGTPTVILDNIIAVKSVASADSLSLTSLLGKAHNLSWAASTTYAANTKRRPTQPNRNGYQYEVTAGGGGSSGSSEPTWPTGIGNTVTDGALTWTCRGVEDTWFGIQSINGTTVLLDNETNTLANAGRGYSGATESVATYKREPIARTMVSAATTVVDAVQDSGSVAGLITFSGGWDRTAMTTQSGETWASGQNGLGVGLQSNGNDYISYVNINLVKFTRSFAFTASTEPVVMRSCHGNNSSSFGVDAIGFTQGVMTGVNTSNNGISGFVGMLGRLSATALVSGGNLSSYGYEFINPGDAGPTIDMLDTVAYNNGIYGMRKVDVQALNMRGYLSRSNGTAGLQAPLGNVNLVNASIAESTEFAAMIGFGGYAIKSTRHDQTDDNHLITLDGGTIVSATDQRHTASGISWKFRPTSTTRSDLYPMVLSVGMFKCDANVARSFTIWTRRDSTDIKGRLFIAGGQLPGFGDTYVDCTPSINTWTQSSTLTVTPTAAGVIEVKFLVWDGVGTTNNFWIDDIGAS